MPDYSLNELVFTDLSDEAITEIEALAVNDKGHVDFDILLPRSEELRGEWGPGDAQRVIALWGTKWNAQGNYAFEMVQKPSHRTLILRFITAGSGPYRWLQTLLKTCKVSVEYHICNEKLYSFSTTLDQDCGTFFKWQRIDRRTLLHEHLCEVFTQAAGY